jgi:hypothetical protein
MNPDATGDCPRPSALAALRRFARPRAAPERCDLCGTGLAEEHQHLVELANRKLCCACEACALLFANQGAAKYRRVPRDAWALTDFHLTDGQWEELQLPINLAFFLHSTAAGRVVAMYPSPAGATEALPSQEAWRILAEANPVLGELEPDVEALLVNRLGPTPEYFRVGIDECYKLVGHLRTHWRGISGGPAVWEVVGQFIAALKGRARPAAGTPPPSPAARGERQVTS